ncbi:MAG: hypothetical protein P1U80_11110 [Pseudomonadales bacterium]|nr:hypothetical protein [Pseudomonadales bacterium]
MDAFEYVMVIVSIITGLGLSTILTGVGELIQGRKIIRIYGIHLIWVGFIFLLQVELWWVWWELRSRIEWDLASFFLLLLHPIVLYVLSIMAFPNISMGDEIDLREYYYDNKTWFFGVFSIYPVLNIVRDFVFLDAPMIDVRHLFLLCFIGITIGLAWTKIRWVHRYTAYTTVSVAMVYMYMFVGGIAD